MGEEGEKMGVVCEAGGEGLKVSSELSVMSFGRCWSPDQQQKLRKKLNEDILLKSATPPDNYREKLNAEEMLGTR